MVFFTKNLNKKNELFCLFFYVFFVFFFRGGGTRVIFYKESKHRK